MVLETANCWLSNWPWNGDTCRMGPAIIQTKRTCFTCSLRIVYVSARIVGTCVSPPLIFFPEDTDVKADNLILIFWPYRFGCWISLSFWCPSRYVFCCIIVGNWFSPGIIPPSYLVIWVFTSHWISLTLIRFCSGLLDLYTKPEIYWLLLPIPDFPWIAMDYTWLTKFFWFYGYLGSSLIWHTWFLYPVFL